MILNFLSSAWKGMVDLLFLPSVVLLTSLIMCLCPASSLRSCYPHPAAVSEKFPWSHRIKEKNLASAFPPAPSNSLSHPPKCQITTSCPAIHSPCQSCSPSALPKEMQ